MSESQSRAWVWANTSTPSGMPTGDRLRAVPTSPAVSPIRTTPTVSLSRAFERGPGKLAQRSCAAISGLPLRLEADHRRPFLHGETPCRRARGLPERTRRVACSKSGWPDPVAGPVGGNAGGREELAEAAAACLEAGPECSQADGDSSRQRPPGPIVGLVVTAVRKPAWRRRSARGVHSSGPATS